MPCIGPDCDGARGRGEEVARAMIRKMFEDHKLTDFSKHATFSSYKYQQRLEANIDTIVKTVGEMFVDEACFWW